MTPRMLRGCVHFGGLKINLEELRIVCRSLSTALKIPRTHCCGSCEFFRFHPMGCPFKGFFSHGKKSFSLQAYSALYTSGSLMLCLPRPPHHLTLILLPIHLISHQISKTASRKPLSPWGEGLRLVEDAHLKIKFLLTSLVSKGKPRELWKRVLDQTRTQILVKLKDA
ncbi:hypothetical protein GWK47_035352 [Chionoecetes opilio]|uniref:Uncharacterized protein n=1 Tax=Chionoecetes opilio TaxID=41210 RepID=A0A8J5CZI0_CHIOP|nr:hypothetical protein GWK47_035352 [Chionoecetes opilio]